MPQVSCCQHAVINAPANSNSVCFARVLSDGSLPHVKTGSAFASHGFGTCSVFIRITACSLADPLPISGLLHQGLRAFHCFHARLGCYRLERKLPGGILSPTGVLRLCHGALERAASGISRLTLVALADPAPSQAAHLSSASNPALVTEPCRRGEKPAATRTFLVRIFSLNNLHLLQLISCAAE